MTKTETAQLATALQEIRDMSKRLEKMEGKVDELQTSFDTLSGGKKALMWVTGTFIAVCGLVLAFLNLRKD